ncbi:MAG: hypothetical protein HFH41_03915 [Lachnospiraceae bacterium]|nr:hypothetical protein [Lachnospiraceae bacterium]
MQRTITREIMEQSQYFEGNTPETWELIGIYNNGSNYIRYYRNDTGSYRHTCQKIKKDPAKIVLWKNEEGKEFAKRVYPKRRKRQQMA